MCAYTSLVAQLAVADEALDRAAVCVLVDKEEIGSVGATGMASQFFENTIAEIMELAGEGGMPAAAPRAGRIPRMLSSDVSAGFDPAYARRVRGEEQPRIWATAWCSTSTRERAARAGSNDASAEYMARIRKRHGRRRRAVPNLPSWARSTPAAAGPSRTSPPSTAWTSSTPAWRCFPCTAPGRPPARPTSTRPNADTRRSCAHNGQRVRERRPLPHATSENRRPTARSAAA